MAFMTALKSWATWDPGKKPEGARMKADVEMLLGGSKRKDLLLMFDVKKKIYHRSLL